MIQRRREYGKQEPTRDAHKIYIVCEGKGTEPAYFAFFEGLSSNLEVITIPPKEGTDPLKLMERAKQDLADVGDLETDSRMEGNTLLYIYGPKRGATKTAPQKPATEPKAAGEATQQTEEVNNA